MNQFQARLDRKRHTTRTLFRLALASMLIGSVFVGNSQAQDTNESSIKLKLRSRIETTAGSGNFHAIEKDETWNPLQTAIIVCDMWDLHHSQNAVIRVGQLAPRMDTVLRTARNQGVTIVHAPSSCMDFYSDHAARKRAIAVPVAANMPDGIEQWCTNISAEDAGVYPIDQSDGGEDDDPVENAKWQQKLATQGLNPKMPWTRQTKDLHIDETKDFISDSGQEIWSILEDRRISNVVLVGVHTNMCVLGRPFGLRQMAKNGKHVVLIRDMTDTMYNPQAKPYVSHFSGTDLIVEHIEKYVCPTITSDQWIGGRPFVFPDDQRKHIAIVMAEDEYETEQTLPEFAETHLRKDFRISLVFGSQDERNQIPGIESIHEADIVLLSIRRRTLPGEQLDVFRQFAATRKPMIGIRTSSHAFCLRNDRPPAGLAEWPEFDAEVWGGNYSGHTRNGSAYKLVQSIGTGQHSILSGVDLNSITGHMSMYLTEPLEPGTTCLFRGVSKLELSRPAAGWTFERASGGTSFYTSLGHKDDFQQTAFQRLLKNAVTTLATAAPHSSDAGTQ